MTRTTQAIQTSSWARLWGMTLLVALLGVVVGCATPPPPRHLLNAREAFKRVRGGKAAQLTPAELHTAKKALQEAEESYLEDAGSPLTTTLAYVAWRQAQQVESKAQAKAAEQELERAEQALDDLQEQELTRARQRLSVQEKALAEEREAREKAEERERAALQQLAEAAALNMTEDERGTVLVLPDNVLFASGRFELTPSAQGKLRLVASTLAPQSETHDIVVEGHTDSRGNHAYNMELSQRRAQSVMHYLVANGVQADAIKAVGMGPDRPVASNQSRSGRAQNRRVEIIIKR